MKTGTTSKAKANAKEFKMITVLGTNVAPDQKVTLHTAKCECGMRLVRAKSQQHVENYIKGKHAGCCGSDYTYAGEQTFKGDKLITLKEVKKTEKVEPTGLVTVGRKGISNKQMIAAITANLENTENLAKLFDTYGETFISSAKYFPDKTKLQLEAIIHTTMPNVFLPVGKKSR